MDVLQNLPKLLAETERIRLEFLQTDLALCFTFADLVRIELQIGDWNAARRALAVAGKGHATVARFLPYIADAQRRNEIQRKLNELRVTLDSARHQLQEITSSWIHIF